MKRGLALRGAAAAVMGCAALVGSASTTVANAATERAGAVPASIVAALNHGTHAQQAAIFRTLTPQQQVAVLTPAHATITAVPASDAEEALIAEGITVGNDLGEVGKANGTCPNQQWAPGDWVLTETSYVGVTLYKWHLDTLWSGNCKKITSLDYHFGYPTDVFFLETYKGKLVDTMQGAGEANGFAVAEGSFASCVDIGPFNNCWFSSFPVLHEDFNAWGGRSAWGAS